MKLRPPRSTRTYTPWPYSTLFRSPSLSSAFRLLMHFLLSSLPHIPLCILYHEGESQLESSSLPHVTERSLLLLLLAFALRLVGLPFQRSRSDRTSSSCSRVLIRR